MTKRTDARDVSSATEFSPVDNEPPLRWWRRLRIVPVREIDDHPLGEPGEVTKLVQTRYEDAIYGRLPEYSEWLDPVGEPEPASEPSKVQS